MKLFSAKKLKQEKYKREEDQILSAKENDKIKSLKPGTIKQRQKIYLHSEKYSKIYWIIPLEFKSPRTAPRFQRNLSLGQRGSGTISPRN